MTPALMAPNVPTRPHAQADGLLREIAASLTIIRGECHGMVRSGLASGARMDRLRIIDHQAERIALAMRHVHEVIDTTGRPEPVIERCHLAEIATCAIERLTAIARSRDVALTVRASDDGPVDGRRDVLDRVLEHVLIHAITAAGHAGRVGLRLRVNGHTVRLSVTAWGGDKCSASGGDGVGMLIVRHHVERLGGTAYHAAVADRLVCRIALPLAGT